MLIKRKDIKEVLVKWYKNQISVEQVKKWAEEICNTDHNFEDWEDNDNSVSNEIIHMLENLAMNLILKDDIEVYIKFLNTPPGNFKNGYYSWNKYLEKIDYNERKKNLKSNEFYRAFCQ